MRRTLSQVDVFSTVAFGGNPVAVVHEADGLSEEQMAAFARWTNLSETTFLLPPTTPEADYRLRIFTPGGELPFAGHPTLGSARAWLEAGGRPREEGRLVQECGIGLVPLRRGGGAGRAETLAFAAPALLREGPLDEATLDQALRAIGVPESACRASAWIDNGPGWLGLFLDSADTVLELRPDFAVMGDLKVGVIGPYAAAGVPPAPTAAPEVSEVSEVSEVPAVPAPSEVSDVSSPAPPADFEVRAFVPALGVPEDPVTGSLNAGFAVWLMAAGLAPQRYTVSQGTALRRTGRLLIEREGDDIWVGGHAKVRIRGELDVD